MKKITMNAYTIRELKEVNKAAYNKLYEKFQDIEYFWMDNSIKSVKEFFTFLNIPIKDYTFDINYCTESYIKFILDNNVKSLHGSRALAWLENNLLSKIREKRPFDKRYKDGTKYNKFISMPFTGYYMDDVILDYVITSINKGNSIGNTLHDIAWKVSDEMRLDYLEYIKEENFIEKYEYDGILFTMSGDMITAMEYKEIKE